MASSNLADMPSVPRNPALRDERRRRALNRRESMRVDAMPNGGKIHTKISKPQEWTGQQRRGLRVTFGDDGCGIASDDLQKILEPFFTTKGASGNGIGLSLVRDTVQKNDGKPRGRSSTKRGRSGSVFSIFLPAAAPKHCRDLAERPKL